MSASRMYSDTDIVREIRRVYNMLDHTPSENEFDEHSEMSFTTVQRRYESYNAGVEAAGLEPNVWGNEYIPTDELLFDLECGAECLGHPPSTREYRVFGEYSLPTVLLRFGSWEDALRECGLWDEYVSYQESQDS